MLPEEAFAWMDSQVPPNARVLELGSGEGTRRLCEMFPSGVTSVEHNPTYLYTTPATYLFAPIRDDWYHADALAPQLPPEYDFLLIDGPPGALRPNVVDHLRLFRQDVPILYDDTERSADRAAVEALGRLLHRAVEHFAAPSRGAHKTFSVIP